MKRSLTMMVVAALILGLTGCGSIAPPGSAEQTVDVRKIERADDQKEQEYGSKEERREAAGELDFSAAEDQTVAVNITVGDQVFAAQFYENETAQALLEKMPLTIELSELNGNEKFYDLPERLPFSGTEKPEMIQAGEIMLWSPDTLVLFYESFPNSYGGYVRLGYVQDTSGLARALGTGNITVTFRKA